MDKDIKDLLSSTLQETVSSVNKYQGAKMAEKKERKNSIKKVVKWYLIVNAVFLVIGWVFLAINEHKESSAKDKVADYIEQGDFITARKIAHDASSYEETDLLFKVANAQVSELVSRGEFDLANEIAKEEKFYITFFNSIIDHLTKIYSQQGANQLFYAMTLISFPNEKEKLPDFWGSHKTGEKTDDIIIRSNKNIESFCDYLKQIGDESFIPKMLRYLKPHYVEAVKKWDSTNQKDIIVKAEHMDYSEVKRIKAKFGY